MAPRPFFEAPGRSPARRRLLLVSPHFPPSGEVGALRWQKMARHVAERGWGLDVVTFHPDEIAAPDWRRLDELPPGTRLYGVHAPAVPLARLIEGAWERIRSIRSRVLTSDTARPGLVDDPGAPRRPDTIGRREIRWMATELRSYVRAYNAWHMYAELKRLARTTFVLARDVLDVDVHDAIISSGPPHAAHETARLLSRRTGVPFVMDMRDLWSLAQRCSEAIASPLLFRLGGRYERRAVDQASLIILNTEVAREAMARAYPEATGRMIAVMNGYDDDPLPVADRGDRFVVAYAGTIYLDRDPSGLFRAARRVIERLRLTPEQFGIEFIGPDWSVPFTELADAAGVGSYVRVGPARPRAEALEFLAGAAMLVILPQDTDLAIPAKVFEYVRFDAWVLALAERGSATELVLRDTAADVVTSTDIDAIAAVLTRRYREYAAGVRPRAIAADVRLSRAFQGRRLLDALEGCVRPLGVRSPADIAPVAP